MFVHVQSSQSLSNTATVLIEVNEKSVNESVIQFVDTVYKRPAKREIEGFNKINPPPEIRF